MATDLAVLPEMETGHDSVIGKVTEALTVETVALVETRVELPESTDLNLGADEVDLVVEEGEALEVVPKVPL